MDKSRWCLYACSAPNERIISISVSATDAVSRSRPSQRTCRLNAHVQVDPSWRQVGATRITSPCAGSKSFDCLQCKSLALSEL